MEKCIFCGIIAKEVEAKIVYEDEVSLAFLDINPKSKGMTIVVPKVHYFKFDENLEITEKVFHSALKVARMIEKALKPSFVSIAMLPSKVEHFHLRIYPFYENQLPLLENQPINISEKELDEVVDLIKRVELEEEVKKVEKKPKERSKEEVYWIKREISLT